MRNVLDFGLRISVNSVVCPSQVKQALLSRYLRQANTLTECIRWIANEAIPVQIAIFAK